MITSSAVSPRNRVLNSLPYNEFEKIKFELKLIKVEQGDVIHQSNEAVKWVYFPENCIVSTVTVFKDGTSIENGIVGREGLLGAASALSTVTTPREAAVQTSGECLRMPIENFREAFDDNRVLRQLSLNYVFAFFEQVAQAGACNKHHTVNERIARWLLTLHDRSESDELQVTQDLMAQMLGVHRPGVTLAAIYLKSAGLIDYRRGSVRILDRAGLENAACECYPLIKRAYDQYITILELQALTSKLDNANRRFEAVIEQRRMIQNVTHHKVANLRSVVAGANDERKPDSVCIHCDRVGNKNGDWIEVESAQSETRKKNGAAEGICNDCEILLESVALPFERKAKNRRK